MSNKSITPTVTSDDLDLLTTYLICNHDTHLKENLQKAISRRLLQLQWHYHAHSYSSEWS